MISVERIRPEEGLGRKRDRAGHQELCQSIREFGVLTPITVRSASDGSDDFLLVKGQGRTLACRLLEIPEIPAIVVGERFAEAEKVQQFLVENVARLRMRAVDRALLVARARLRGEETASVAHRFGISAATVRKLQAQLDGASSGELAALKSGEISLTMHAAIIRHVHPDERANVVSIMVDHSLRAQEAERLFLALGWSAMTKLGPNYRNQRLSLLGRCCATLSELPKGDVRERIAEVARRLPATLGRRQAAEVAK